MAFGDVNKEETYTEFLNNSKKKGKIGYSNNCIGKFGYFSILKIF